MRTHFLMLIAILAISSGCNVQTGVSPVDTVIAKSSERDFGFVGTWSPVPDDNFPLDKDTYEIVVALDAGYSVSIGDQSRDNNAKLNVNFRTHEISQDLPHAIVEIELIADDKIAYRRLAIAAVKDDHLYLWMIDGKKIAEHLYNDGVATVIEHFAFSTTIRCDPEKLLESMSKHSAAIVGTAQVFRRKPDKGR